MKQIQLKLQESSLARILPSTLEDTICNFAIFLKEVSQKVTSFTRETELGLAVVFHCRNRKEPLVYSPRHKTTFLVQEDFSSPTVLRHFPAFL